MKFNIIKKVDEHEFKPILTEIEDEPTSPLGRMILWLLVSVLLIGLTILIVAKIDIVVSARGFVIPEGEVKIIQPLEGGIVNDINVRVGDFVKKGDVLMVIEPSAVESDYQSKKENLVLTSAEIKCINNLLSGDTSDCESKDMAKYLQSLDNMNYELKIKGYQVDQLKETLLANKVELSTLKELLNSEEGRKDKLESVIDIISYDEYKRSVDTIISYKKDISNLEHSILSSNHQKAQLLKEVDVIRGNAIGEWKTELSNLVKAHASLRAEVEQAAFRHEKQQIYAPTDGYVSYLNINTIGGVVTAAQPIVTLVPTDANLMVKVQVLNKDIGFIQLEQECVIKMDTYEFQKYGKIEGKIIHIAADSIENEQLGRVYEVYIKPEKLSLMVDGRESYVNSGMSLTAEVKVGKRRVIEIFIYPAIRYLDEGLSIR